MTDRERLEMAIIELEKRISYVDVVLKDKNYIEAAVSDATNRMRRRKERYPEILKELKSILASLD